MSHKKLPVIFDTDIGLDIDDTWALGFLLKCPEFDVKLITVSSDNTPLKAKLIAKFLEMIGRNDIPIGIGPQENVDKGMLYDWIADYVFSQYPGFIHEDAASAICSTISDSTEPITVIAVGPLGTIAEALKMNPKITENSRFVGMQGSIYSGYFGGRPSKEYNVKKNVKACRDVFKASWQKTITPLDTCGKVILIGDHYDRLMRCDNSIVKAIKENVEIWKSKITPQLIKENQTSTLYDTVAVYLGFSEELLNIEDLPIEISEHGATKISKSGNIIRCATSWKDLAAFKTLLVNRLIN